MELDGIMIWVQDVPATVAFYEAAFGLERQMMDDARPSTPRWRTGATTLAFADERAAATTGITLRPHRRSDDPAAVQLAFVHDDVASAYERAVAAGAVRRRGRAGPEAVGPDPRLPAGQQRLPGGAVQPGCVVSGLRGRR